MSLDDMLPGGDVFAVYKRESEETLERILDSMDSYIYVTDMDTDEILFINKTTARDFGLNHSFKGDVCWKHLQPGMERRCDFCPKSRLIANPDEPVRSKIHNLIVDKAFSTIGRVIDWPDGRRVHMEQAIDVTEAEHARDARQTGEFFRCDRLRARSAHGKTVGGKHPPVGIQGRKNVL